MKCEVIKYLSLGLLILNLATICQTSTITTTQPSQPAVQSLQDEEGSSQNAVVEALLASLRRQDWSDDDRCLRDIVNLLQSVHNHTIWATWVLESMNVVPLGHFYGTRNQLGNYDECLTSPWSSTHSELASQYCLTEVEFQDTAAPPIHAARADPYETTFEYIHYHERLARNLDRLLWGVCLPSSCTTQGVQRFTEVLVSISHLRIPGTVVNVTVDSCQRSDQKVSYDIPFISFVSFVVLLTLTCLVCTYLNCSVDDPPDTLSYYLIKSFCVVENSKSLLNVTADGLEVLYGIRFLTIALIVMGHQVIYYNVGPISNGWFADIQLDSVKAMFMIHNDLFVDTFFMMSGMLVIRAFMYFKRLPNLVPVILKRYIRLASGLAMALFYITTALPYTGDGPLWPRYTRTEMEPCKKNWWLNLLMLSNYVDTTNMCYIVTWYIPCDFHMFLLALLLFWVYLKKRTLAMIFAVGAGLASVAIPSFVNYWYALPPFQIRSYESHLHNRVNDTFNIFYVRSHNRFAAYMVGMLAGFIFSQCKPSETKVKLLKRYSTLGALVGLKIMISIMLYGSWMHHAGWGQVECVMYAGLNRPIWAVGLALLVLSCVYGSVPIIKPFLTWYPWVPLSKLAFGIYITHGLLIYRNIYMTRNLNQYDEANIAVDTIGVLALATVLAYLLWLLVEAPINNIFMVVFVPRPILKKIHTRTLTKDDIDGVETSPNGAAEVQNEKLEGHTRF